MKENTPIYLDYNATTPVCSKAIEAAVFAMKEGWANPGCQHRLGTFAREIIETAREQVKELIGVRRGTLLFLSGGTEANNMVLTSTFTAIFPHRAHLITTKVEHPSVLNPAIRLMEMGYDVTFLDVDANCLVDPDAVKKALRPSTRLVSIMLANNEVGSIQPVREIAMIARERGILVHSDASQAIGKIPVDVEELGVDYLTMAGHKFYAPKGIGALYVREGAPLEPLMLGGGQEGGMRPGTEPVPLIAAMGAAASDVKDWLSQGGPGTVKRLRDFFLKGLERSSKVQVIPNIRLELALPNTLSVSFKGMEGWRILKETKRVMASTGAACHEGGTGHVSHVLSSMGISREQALGTVRFSLGRYTTQAELEEAVVDVSRTIERIIG